MGTTSFRHGGLDATSAENKKHQDGLNAEIRKSEIQRKNGQGFFVNDPEYFEDQVIGGKRFNSAKGVTMASHPNGYDGTNVDPSYYSSSSSSSSSASSNGSSDTSSDGSSSSNSSINDLIKTQQDSQLTMMEKAFGYRTKESEQAHGQQKDIMKDQFGYRTQENDQNFRNTLGLQESSQKFQADSQIRDIDYKKQSQESAQQYGLTQQEKDIGYKERSQESAQRYGLTQQERDIAYKEKSQDSSQNFQKGMQDDSQAFTLQRDEVQHGYSRERDRWGTDQRKELLDKESQNRQSEQTLDTNLFLKRQKDQRQAALNMFAGRK